VGSSAEQEFGKQHYAVFLEGKMSKRTVSVLAILAGLAYGTMAQAGIPLQNGLYRLSNHPDGNQLPPPYGLRLDGLGGTPSHVYTFDFNHDDGAGNTSDMHLFLNQNTGTIHIYGTVYGGLNKTSNTNVYDNSATNDRVGWWYVDFTYSVGVGNSPGDMGGYADVETAVSAQMQNSGSITRIGSWGASTLQQSYTLVDKAGMAPDDHTFRLGDEDSGLGHRFAPGISGWGWLIHSGLPNHNASSDWLFTATPAPVPGAVVMGIVGMGLLGALRRKLS